MAEVHAPASRSRRVPGRYVAAWLVVALSLLACVPAREVMSTGSWYGLSAFALFASSKVAMLLRLDRPAWRRLRWGRLFAFLFWVGLKVEPFLDDGNPGRPPRRSLWLTGLVNLTAGGVLLWGVPHLLPDDTSLRTRLVLGLIGYALWMLFGIGDLWAAVYRACGVPVEKQFNDPPAAESLADFWGNRWNRIYSDFARDLLVRPLAPVLGAGIASLCVFLFAGTMHEWAWSLPAGGGYGGPMLYFLIQWLGVRLEGTHGGRRRLRGTTLGRIWSWVVVLAPSPLLLHGPMLEGFVLHSLLALKLPGLTPV